MKKLIIILGAGIMQIPALNAAKKLELVVCAFDKSKNAPGIRFTDYFFNIDLHDLNKIVLCIQDLSRQYNIVGVFTAGTDFSTNVAYIAEKFKLPGHSYKSTQYASNKLLMRQCFLKNQIPSPNFTSVNQTTSLIKIKKELYEWNKNKFPQIVIKPVDNMGARGVTFVDSEEKLNDAIIFALNYSRSKQVIIEEFMKGNEISIDALIYDNHIKITGIADRHIYYLPYFIELGHTLPSQENNNILKEVIEIFSRGVRALGLSHGAAKGDIKITPQGVKIGEIAARLSGGYMSGWTYPLSSGINLTQHAIELAIGIKPSLDKNPTTLCPLISAEWALISIPGIIEEILYLDAAKNTPLIKHCFLKIKKGDVVSFPKNNIEKCGNFIACGPQRSLVEKAVHNAIRTIFIKLEPKNLITETFLLDSNPIEEQLDLYGYDHNLLSYPQIQKRFSEITLCSYNEIPQEFQQKFQIAVKRGGLQGAIWFYDSFIKP